MAEGFVELYPGAERREVEVFNDSDRPIRVTSHIPLDRVNRALRFVRTGMDRFHLDIPTWSSLKWDPQERKTVIAVAFKVPE